MSSSTTISTFTTTTTTTTTTMSSSHHSPTNTNPTNLNLHHPIPPIIPLPSSYTSPFIDLPRDIFRRILTNIAGESLDTGVITTHAYRQLLPFAIVSRHHYILTLSCIRGLALLPVSFTRSPTKNTSDGRRRKPPPFPIALLASSQQQQQQQHSLCISVLPPFNQQQQLSHSSSSSTQKSSFLSQSFTNITSTTTTTIPDPRLSERLPRFISRLINLRTLHLFRNSEVSDSALYQIAYHAPQLHELRLRACRTITRCGLQSIAKFCRELRLLDLSYSHNLKDDVLPPMLIHLPKLHTLQLAYWPISDIGVDSILSSTSSVKTLDLTACNCLTVNSCIVIANSNIEHLRLRSSPVLGDEALKALSFSKTLKSLDVGLSRRVTDIGVSTLLNNSNNKQSNQMISLKFSHCTQITDDGIIPNCFSTISTTYLQSLDFSFCYHLTDNAAKALTLLPYLHTLDMSACHALTDQAVIMLTKLPWLKRISLSRCPNLTDQAVDALIHAAATPLHFIDLRKCPRISEDALKILAQHCQQLLPIPK